MSEIWFEESLVPDLDILESASKGESSEDRPPVTVSSSVRVNIPRTRILSTTEIGHMAMPTPNYKYLLVRLGCEFDPGPAARAEHISFDSAVFQVYIHASGPEMPRVYSLAPVEFDKGKPGNVKLKLEPSLTFVSGAGGSLGGIETDLAIGRVAPVVRGFTGKDERQPYWNLESHKEFPLYGLRHFWLILEAPPSTQDCYLSCRVEAFLTTILGRLFMRPAKREIEHRPRYKITFA